MSKCSFPHCGRMPAVEHPQHAIHLCERCYDLVERFGHPRTLGDLSGLVTLAVLKFGKTKVRAALSRLESVA